MKVPKFSAQISLDKEKIKSIPNDIGVYLFIKKGKKKEDEILYVGKSLNIKTRILTHLENAKLDRKESLILQNSNSLGYIITDSEFKALLLESELIQKLHPKYNNRWKDDKSYLYIKISVREEFPKIFPVRRENDHKSLYFGPFSSTQDVQIILREVRKIFPFCMQKKISKSPCFYSKIGLCNPCPNAIEKIKYKEEKIKSKKIYRTNIKQVIKILRGETEIVEKSLNQSLQKFKKQENYEEALSVRNKLFNFQRLIRQQLFQGYESVYSNITAVKDLLQILHFYMPALNNVDRIECYDISNLSQKEATASMVVFSDGFPKKDQYRKFRIKNISLNSDFQMLEEVIKRRFKNNWLKPDLIIVDGGKPQVRTLLRTLAQIKKKIPVVGIAKGPDRLVVGTENLPTIRPKISNSGFNLIRYIRDESHRFAKKYHLFLRNKRLYNEL